MRYDINGNHHGGPRHEFTQRPTEPVDPDCEVQGGTEPTLSEVLWLSSWIVR